MIRPSNSEPLSTCNFTGDDKRLISNRDIISSSTISPPFRIRNNVQQSDKLCELWVVVVEKPVALMEWNESSSNSNGMELSYPRRLTRCISWQVKDRLREAHDSFASAMRALETRHSERLERTEEQRLRVRKQLAPRVARLALESVSIRDVLLFGMSFSLIIFISLSLSLFSYIHIYIYTYTYLYTYTYTYFVMAMASNYSSISNCIILSFLIASSLY